nr:EamA family transporter [Fusobacterium varium]
MGLILLGTVTATVGITFLISAFNLINAGVASTFSSISPIIVIPISIIVFKEKVKMREILGAFVSVFGIALFFL